MGDWDSDEQGNIIVCPVTGWHAAPAFHSSCVLRMTFAPTPGALETGDVKALQFVMTPDQAAQLAADLLAIAQHIKSQQAPQRTELS